VTTDLTDRYGAPSRLRRPLGHRVALLQPVRRLGRRGWTVWFHTNPAVTSDLVTFDVTSDHEVAARLDVRLADDVEASCRLRALAEDKTAVGEVAFAPVDGSNSVVIRTERRATSVEKLGCTAPGQARPR
jgi:uncharacterized membrane protein